MKTEDLTAYTKQKESVEKEITSCLLSINNKMEECYSGLSANYQDFFQNYADMLYKLEIKKEYYSLLLEETEKSDLETIQAYMMDVISTLTQELIEIKIGSSCVGGMKHLAAVLEFEAKQELLVKFTELACNIDI